MITLSSITLLWPGAWSVGWPSTTGPVDVWVSGVCVARGRAESSITIMSQGVPPVEVVLANTEAQSASFRPFAQLQWRGTSGVDGYMVERKTGDAWKVIGTPLKEDGRGYYTFKSQPRPDGTLDKYRVSALKDQAKGAPVEFDVLIVRYPPAPTVSITYSAEPTPHITVAEAVEAAWL